MSDAEAVRSRWLKLRVNEAEFNEIMRLQAQTTSRSFSEYARDILLRKPVIVKYRNTSADDFLSAMIPLKNELNHLGVNLNQAVRKLHTSRDDRDIKAWLTHYHPLLTKVTQEIDAIKIQLAEMYSKWFQG